MKGICIVFVVLLVLLSPSAGFSAETSSDQRMLEWTSEKVWVTNGCLCVTGTFVNKRNSLTVTKLNDFVMAITFTKEDGSKYQFIGKPAKLPLCKIPPGGIKQLTLNFGTFDGTWKNWITTQQYVFSYVNGARW